MSTTTAGPRLRAGLRDVPVQGAPCHTRAAITNQMTSGVQRAVRDDDTITRMTRTSTAVMTHSMVAAAHGLRPFRGWVTPR
jgi:hypothetical protein